MADASCGGDAAAAPWPKASRSRTRRRRRSRRPAASASHRARPSPRRRTTSMVKSLGSAVLASRWRRRRGACGGAFLGRSAGVMTTRTAAVGLDTSSTPPPHVQRRPPRPWVHQPRSTVVARREAGAYTLPEPRRPPARASHGPEPHQHGCFAAGPVSKHGCGGRKPPRRRPAREGTARRAPAVARGASRRAGTLWIVRLLGWGPRKPSPACVSSCSPRRHIECT